MGICWYCYWGWPKPVAEIYQSALRELAGDESPLHYGMGHNEEATHLQQVLSAPIDRFRPPAWAIPSNNTSKCPFLHPFAGGRPVTGPRPKEEKRYTFPTIWCARCRLTPYKSATC